VKENFEPSLAAVLQHEGGFVNHPYDPGGMTNLGVTKSVWEAYSGKPATEQDMRSLTKAMVAPLYKKRYWDMCRCDDMPSGIDYLVFDFAVNAGCSRSAKTLQQALKIQTDGIIGPVTLQAAKDADAKQLIDDFSLNKENFYRRLPTFSTFGKGWLNRVEGSKKTAKGMLINSP
jgi:lysozyme family protein